LLGAFGKLAACQGTMNNLTFGNEQLGYYETLAGGAGAGPGFPGASAVHTHMTNTRITDAEVLESRYPVRVVSFSIRRGSGGEGRFRGGDGLVRELEFLAPLEVSLLSDRRTTRPFGLAGGSPGAPGRNLFNGEPVPGRAQLHARAHDRLRIETPGGGGYGAATTTRGSGGA
jgi:5-oxoprolinase (ATP-hydrolysing)